MSTHLLYIFCLLVSFFHSYGAEKNTPIINIPCAEPFAFYPMDNIINFTVRTSYGKYTFSTHDTTMNVEQIINRTILEEVIDPKKREQIYGHQTLRAMQIINDINDQWKIVSDDLPLNLTLEDIKKIYYTVTLRLYSKIPYYIDK